MNQLKRQVPPLRAIKYYYLRLIRLRGNPFVLSRGLAIGVFVGLTPTIPLHTTLILFLCTVLRGNPLAGVLVSVLVSNPLTIPLHYFAAWKIGTILTGDTITWMEIKGLLSEIESRGLLDGLNFLFRCGGSMFGSVLLGGIVLALPCALLSYFASLGLFLARQKKRLQKILEDYPQEDKTFPNG